MKRLATWLAALLLATAPHAARAEDFAALCADRAALERVYHTHRLGTKETFEQALPPAQLAQLVRLDLHKEAVLRRVYGVSIDAGAIDAEVARIDATTRAPEVLAEIKTVLGNDAARFARTMARPIVVERVLRARFENDDKFHAPQRRIAETTRVRMLEVKEGGFANRFAVLEACKDGEVQAQVKWELTARPGEEAATPPAATPEATQGKASSGIYTIEATAQLAQVLSSPEKSGEEKERKFYIEDLPDDLQNVLRAQLRQPGDVSAVIEGPRAFQLFLTCDRTATALTVAVLTIPKRSYEDWLAQQPEP